MKRFVSLLCCFFILIGCCPMVVFATDGEVIISCNDGKSTYTGSWEVSTNNLVYGPTGGNSKFATAVNASVSYSLSEITAGRYDLYVYNLKNYPGATNAQVNLVHQSGTMMANYNPKDISDTSTGNTWVPLGTFYLGGNNAHKLTITNKSGGVLRDAGIKLVPNTDGAAITTPNLTGIESATIFTCYDTIAKCEGQGIWEESSLQNDENIPSKFNWSGTGKVTYDLSAFTGSYDIYLYNLSTGIEPEAASVSVALGNRQISSGNFNPKTSGNETWIALGTYNFILDDPDVNRYLTVTAEGAGCMRIAAIKLIANNGTPVASQLTNVTVEQMPEPEWRTIDDNNPLIILGDNNDALVKSNGWVDSSLPYPEGLGYYTKAVGSWAKWKPRLTEEDEITLWYLVHTVLYSPEDPAVLVEVYACKHGESEKRIHQIELDFTTNGPTGGEGAVWANLGTYDFSGDGDEYIKIIKQEEEDPTLSTVTRLTNLRIGYKDVADNLDADMEPPVYYYSDSKQILERLGLLNNLTEDTVQRTATTSDLAYFEQKLNGISSPDTSNLSNPSSPISANECATMLLEQMNYTEGTDFNTANAFAFFANTVGFSQQIASTLTVEQLAEMTVAAFDTPMKGELRSLLGSVMNKIEPLAEPKYTNPCIFSEEMAQRREVAKNINRDLIYNNDGNDTYEAYDAYPGPFDTSTVPDESVTIENFLAKRTTGLEGSNVDSVFYCTGVYNSYHHVSEIADMRMRDWTPLLIEKYGKDSIDIVLDWCNENNREFMWSMRMNDVHDREYAEEYLDSFKKNNPEYMVSRRADSMFDLKLAAGYWSALDYAEPAVRQRTYDILREVLLNYDVDGLELDFSRWSAYFEQVVTEGNDATPENVERMNNLIRSLRTLTEQVSMEKGKPILLAIHVSDSMDFCKAIGLDVRQWMDEGLIDVVSIRTWGNWQPMQDGLAEYDNYDVPVYLVMDALFYLNSENVDWILEAAKARTVGYDGIQIYNIYDPTDSRFDTLGDKESLLAAYDPSYTEKSRIEIDTDKAPNAKDRFMTYAYNTFGVTFITNGGSTVKTQAVAPNATATRPVDPVKPGFTFAGWYEDASLSTPFSFNNQITTDTFVYAKWTENQ